MRRMPAGEYIQRARRQGKHRHPRLSKTLILTGSTRRGGSYRAFVPMATLTERRRS